MLVGFNIGYKEKQDRLNIQNINNIKIKEIQEDNNQFKISKMDEDNTVNISYLRDDVTLKTGITEDEMREVLINTTGAKTMSHLAKAFVDAENLYGVNAFFMAGVVALESGFATSRRAIEDNNLTGYEVYNDDSEGKLFTSQYESILQTAKHLKENYLTKDSIYYNGLSVDAVQIIIVLMRD
ncbi:mannosyl-glycoendo-beta-N-acetylglucosaminidase family protein [[Clostridium] sordellii ATCC 9714]|nr:mannosyl-glycoendo-beta-N-acetylglucosaminidase family protein [[Clostridium] sordellii ATCC 9714] [Paeniclostridium sordellii ATCC 9714]